VDTTTNELGDDRVVLERLQAYFTSEVDPRVRVGQLKRFSVGFSWITIGFVAEALPNSPRAVELILRIGPPYGLFAPYSSIPETLSLHSLEGTRVPAPKVFWSSDDPHYLGAPFLICEKIPGKAVLPWVAPGTPPLEDDYRNALASQFVDALATLHTIDWQSRPVAKMAEDISVDNAAMKQVLWWERAIAGWSTRSFPMLEWAAQWLKQNCPRAPRVSIVHGDYRTGNFLEQDGRITAILDWELVHLGDPHEDIGWVVLPMYRGGTKFVCRLLPQEELYERYERATGFPVSPKSVTYYKAFSLYKLAGTHIAASRCFEDGRFNDMRMPAMGSQIPTCLRQLEKTIEAA
jgi:aminoglycoside phosphotransferase (APT) family kinase protein